VDVGRDVVFWSQELEWDPTRIMESGTAIANGVLEAMGLQVLSQQKFTGTDNQDAYEAVLLGLQHVTTYKITDVAKAMEYFQQAVDLDPSYGLAYVHLAWVINVFIRYKDPDEEERQLLHDRARQALETALELDSDSAAAISQLGWMTENRELRVQLWERALEIDPNHAHTYVRLGKQMWRDGNLTEAERLYRKSLELKPMDAADHADLGLILNDMGRVEEAIAELSNAIELEPGMPFSHEAIGRMEYFERGNLDEAVTHFRMAYSLDPERGSSANFMTIVYAEMGAREEAIAWMARALHLRPTDYFTQIAAYFSMMMLGDIDAAVSHVEGALELYPRDSHALRELGTHDIDAGRTQIAMERWRQAHPELASGDDPVVELSNIAAAMDYLTNLAQAGRSGQVQIFTERLLPLVGQVRMRSEQNDYLTRIHAALGNRVQALDSMRKEIVDGNRRWGLFSFDQSEFDFMRDDPEFVRLMRIGKADLEEQLERVRQMERKGELAPAPGIDLPDRG
jgi:tetratricopeptide (TPR) repeat protein